MVGRGRRAGGAIPYKFGVKGAGVLFSLQKQNCNIAAKERETGGRWQT